MAEHSRHNAYRTEEDEGLHGVEAHKAILSLKQGEDQAGDPAAQVAQPAGSGRPQDLFRRADIACRWCKVRLPVVLLRSIELLLLLVPSLKRRVIALWRAILKVVGSIERLPCGRSFVSIIGSMSFV